MLKTQIKNIPTVTTKQKDKLMEDIKLLDKEGKENLYSLIKYTAEIDKDKTVYDGKYQRKGVIFNFENFTDDLQKMIVLFVEKHRKEMANNTNVVFDD